MSPAAIRTVGEPGFALPRKFDRADDEVCYVVHPGAAFLDAPFDRVRHPQQRVIVPVQVLVLGVTPIAGTEFFVEPAFVVNLHGIVALQNDPSGFCGDGVAC